MNLPTWKRQVNEAGEAPSPQTSPRSQKTRRFVPLFPASSSVPGFTTYSRRKRPELNALQWVYRNAVLVAAVLLLSRHALHGRITLITLSCALIVSALALIARAVPVAWTRERPLTFLAPLVFAAAVSVGPDAAVLGTALAGWIHGYFDRRTALSRSYVRFQCGQLALSAFAATAVLYRAWPALNVVSGGAGAVAQTASPTMGARLLAAAMLSATMFAAMNTLLTSMAHLGSWKAMLRAKNARSRFGGLALVYLLGILPVVLTAPFGAAYGLIVALPVSILMLLGAQVSRLSIEVQSLRGQLSVGEAMGQASIADSSADIDPAALLERFLTLAQGLVSAERAVVWIMDQESGELSPVVGMPDIGIYAGQKTRFGEGLIGHAAARIRPRLVANAAHDPHRGRREPASGSWLLYPIVVHARLLGVAQWIRPLQNPFTQEDVARLASLVPQAAVALENVRIRETMLSLAATDGLTGLWNHRKMHELLCEELRRAGRYHHPLSVLMMDVDSFKTFNDSYGHPQGDQLLRCLSGILTAGVRTVDHVGRYGGEEFLIVLPETTKDDACSLAERIRVSVENDAFVIVEDRAIRRTISVGVASYPEDALNPAELVQRADEALYRAKRAGKNCVVWA